VALIVLAVVDLVVSGRAGRAAHFTAIDFDLNWVAAHRLIGGRSLYDMGAARLDGMRLVGRRMVGSGSEPYTSFIGLPPTALAHAPFVPFSEGIALALFRVAALVGMLGSVVIAAWSLAPRARVPAALVGMGVLIAGFPFVKTLELGQANELVMLGLAVGMWGVARERWTMAGIGLGVATVLKLSPGLLLVFLVLRGCRRVLLPAVLTGAACIAAAAAVGQPTDVLTWFRDVAPQLSKGTIGIYNQSIVGWGGRMLTSSSDLVTNTPPGRWYVLAYAFALGAIAVLWRARRAQPVTSLELGIVILVAVLAGPLSWDHYMTWAVVAVVPIADITRWEVLGPRARTLLFVALLGSLALLHNPIVVPSSASVAGDWSVRVMTGPYTACALVWLVVAWTLLSRDRAEPPRSDVSEPPHELGARCRGTAAAVPTRMAG
jgi:alpha-1,2-mannosyltransferase